MKKGEIENTNFEEKLFDKLEFPHFFIVFNLEKEMGRQVSKFSLQVLQMLMKKSQSAGMTNRFCMKLNIIKKERDNTHQNQVM